MCKIIQKSLLDLILVEDDSYIYHIDYSSNVLFTFLILKIRHISRF